MHDFISFITHHWVLSSLFVVLFLVVMGYEIKTRASGSKRLSPQEAVMLINRENANVIDLREADSYKNGHIVDSLNLPSSTFDAQIDRLNKFRNKPLILVHTQDSSAAAVVSKLNKAGFNSVFVLAGGLAAWKNANFPLVKG